MSDSVVHAAARRLAELRDQLPEVLRAPWVSHGAFVNTNLGDPVADISDPVVLGRGQVAKHIAVLASPDISEALQQLLESIDDHQGILIRAPYDGWESDARSALLTVGSAVNALTVLLAPGDEGVQR